jgi:hypothetical protein
MRLVLFFDLGIRQLLQKIRTALRLFAKLISRGENIDCLVGMMHQMLEFNDGSA